MAPARKRGRTPIGGRARESHNPTQETLLSLLRLLAAGSVVLVGVSPLASVHRLNVNS